jgi:2-hydroxychromene-2-carboxylate isomerase
MRFGSSRRGRSDQPRPNFFGFDLASVETYVVADRVLKGAPADLEWIPLAAVEVTRSAPLDGLDADRRAAERRAQELDLPLSWPKGHPRPVPRAMRAAAYAARAGRGGEFMQASARLAFAAGFDLDTPDAIESAARKAKLDPAAVLGAADNENHGHVRLSKLDSAWLASRGIAGLPALHLNGVLACGQQAVAGLLRIHGE